MRIQWNQLGCTEKNYLKGMKHDFYTRHAGYICPCCGIEIFSEWHLFQGANYLEYHASDVPKSTQLVAEVQESLVKNEVELDRKKMQDEAVAFAELETCPCCGGQLSHESTHFIQVETAWSGYDWEKSDFFFKNNTCLYAPNYGVIGTEAAFQAIWKVNSIDKMFTFLHEKQQGIGEQLAKESVSALTAQFDIPVSASLNADVLTTIKSNPEKLQEFFLKIINLEKNIELLKQRLFFLYSSSYRVNQQAKLAQSYPILSERNAVTEKINGLQSELQNKINKIAEIQKYRDRIISEKVVPPSVPFPVMPTEPEKPAYATPNLFNKKKVNAENEVKTAKYNNDMILYNKAIAEYPVQLAMAQKQQDLLYTKAVSDRKKEINEVEEKLSEETASLNQFRSELELKKATLEREIEQLQNNIDYPAVQLKISLDKEISTAEELLADLFKSRNQLYGTGIVFGKYHDLVAITSFYEYLLSGRCETLEGVNGCYNLYESEIRANTIISKLAAIGDSLEQIKNNQYMLYAQLTEINTEVNVLNTTTTTLLKGVIDTAECLLNQNAVIAHNSAVSAFYAKLNAEIASSNRYISMICW